MKKIVMVALSLLLCVSGSLSLYGCGKPKRELIIVDGGGAQVHYNSTTSMVYDKEANPYPYNTLEQLAKEWNSSSDKYEIKIASKSLNNNRESLVPALTQGTAPQILFYLPTTIAEDMTKNWFVDLVPSLDKPNKYSKPGENGSEKWRDVYDPQELSTTIAPNGAIYTAEIDTNPIGLLYNKTMFTAAGISGEPQTYKEFMEAQDKVNAYALTQSRGDKSQADYIVPYFPMYPWYDIFIESSLFANELDKLDVLRKDGVVDSEEMVRAYVKKDASGERLYKPSNARSYENYRLIKQMTKYYPDSFDSYFAEKHFLNGDVAMLEVSGGDIKRLATTVDGAFDVGVFPYPKVTKAPAGEEGNPYYTTFNENDMFVRRGISGLTSGWAVTSSAMKGGDEMVAASIDFLQYVTAYQNNDRLVNDKGFSIPLSGNTKNAYFASLASAYKADKLDSKSVSWASFSPAASTNKEYYDNCYNLRKDIVKNDISQLQTLLNEMDAKFSTTANKLVKTNKWDPSKWPNAQ